MVWSLWLPVPGIELKRANVTGASSAGTMNQAEKVIPASACQPPCRRTTGARPCRRG